MLYFCKLPLRIRVKKRVGREKIGTQMNYTPNILFTILILDLNSDNIKNG